MRVLLAVLRFCAGAFSLGVAAVALLAFLGFAVPFLDLLNHLQLLIFPAVLIGLIATALLRPGRWRAFVVAFAATGFIASSTAFIPEVVWSLVPRTPLPSDARPVMKLMTHNVFGLNYRMDGVAEVIFAENPDIIALQEYFSEQRVELHGLISARYPYVAQCVGEGRRANIAIYSKIEFRIADLSFCAAGDQYQNAGTSLIAAVFTLDDGTGFTLMTTHLDWPFRDVLAAEQRAALALAVAETPGPILLVADMNLTPWSYAFRGFELGAGLERHTHNVITYPLSFTLPMFTNDPLGLVRLIPFLPLDHVFTRDGVAIHELHRGADTNSDHLPVVVTFSVEPMTECCAT